MKRPAVRLLASACAAALLFGASPGLTQVGMPALDRALAPIPAPRDVAYPGVITLDMDATDIDRRIVSVKQIIPVTGPGPLILLYPQWIPGNHGPVGPVDDIGDLRITANGQPLRWVRNTAHTNAYEVEVPAGAASVDV
ncbi:MAG: M61 family metallopeptidase, partial [Brevundimonas sp.]